MVFRKTTYSQSFFARPTLKVAPELLGAFLNRRLPSGLILSAQISEVEAYTADDPACHAYKGETNRCRVLFGPPGRAYVYFIYGMYHCLNIVTEPDGVAGAILIRGLREEGLDGPGKICREWQIDKQFNELDLLNSNSSLWLSPPKGSLAGEIQISPRIGISQAKERMWRFFLPTVKEKRSRSQLSNRRKKV